MFYKTLSLSGGGYRGLYTASVIQQLEENAKVSMGDHCQLIAGTSIGGILALGLAAGLPAKTLVKGFVDHGDLIFPNNLRKKFLNWIMPKYNVEGLRSAIVQMLGEEIVGKSLSELKTSVLVTSVCLESGKTAIISNLEPEYKHWSVMDAALATSAAPTYFPHHEVDGKHYVDGGLSCNVPDMAAYGCIIERLKKDIDQIQMLSIGTCFTNEESIAYKGIQKNAGKAKWSAELVDLVFDSQRNIIVHQCEKLAPKGRYIRIDSDLTDLPELSSVSVGVRKKLLSAATEAVKKNITKPVVNSFLS